MDTEKTYPNRRYKKKKTPKIFFAYKSNHS